MISERDYPIEVLEIPNKLKDRMSKQYNCPTCKKILPKAIYMQAKKPKYCYNCGQKLKFLQKSKKELVELGVLNDHQKNLLERVDNILEGKEYVD